MNTRCMGIRRRLRNVAINNIITGTKTTEHSVPGRLLPVCHQCVTLRKTCCLPFAGKGCAIARTILVSPLDCARYSRRARSGNEKRVMLRAFQSSYHRRTCAQPTSQSGYAENMVC